MELYDPANRIANPGTEQVSGATVVAWALGGLAASHTEGYSEAKSIGLKGQAGGVGDGGSGAIAAIRNTVVGRQYRWSFYVRYRPGSTGSITLNMTHDRGDGFFQSAGSTYTSTSTAWVLRVSNTFVAAAPGPARIQLDVPLPGGFLVVAYYDVDHFIAEDVTPVEAAVPSEDMTLAENTPGDVEFQRGVYDDLHGTLHKEGRVRRDYDQRLRDKRDPFEPDADWLRRGWGPGRRSPRKPL